MATFLDTNVLVYAVDRHDPRKNRIARAIIADLETPFAVSAQVLNEFYSVATRKLDPPLPPSIASATVRKLAAGRVVGIDAQLVLAALDVSVNNQLSIWDALIVCAANRAGCHTLLSEDLNHGQVIEGVAVVNPFLGA